MQEAKWDEPIGELWYPSVTLDAFPASSPIAPHPWRRILCSHTSAVNACAAHPTKPHVYASGGASGEAFVWHAGARAPLGHAPITTTAGPITAVQFSPCGAHLVLGHGNGRVEVHSQGRRLLHRVAACGGRVTDLKFAPAGSAAPVLAAAGSDCAIALLAPAQGYHVYARCCGHAAAVAHLDFSADGRVLRSVCAACEARPALHHSRMPAVPDTAPDFARQ